MNDRSYIIILIFQLILWAETSCTQHKDKTALVKNDKTMHQQNSPIPPEATHCISGLVYLILEEGDGKEKPGSEDTVKAYVTPVFRGKRDLSKDGLIQTISLKETSAGLSEAFQLMNTGQKIRVWLPPKLQNPDSQNNSEVAVYELELLDFDGPGRTPNIPNQLVSPRYDE